MKRALIIALTLIVSACSHKPVIPCDSLTASCGEASEKKKPKQVAGLDAAYTVQLMVNRPTLINGKPADPIAWPVSVYGRSSGGNCSATVVGERVLFMAAHCMSNQTNVSFTVGANRYNSRCAHYPKYRSGSYPANTADFALCLVDRPVTGPVYEVLGVDESLSIGDEILLTGYGCTRPGGGGGNDGIFRIGEAKVEGLPSGNNYDIVTLGGAALCFGDSGGAAYKVYPDGRRRVLATNSRGNIRNQSYLSAVFNGGFKEWAVKWAAENNNVKICGIHSDAKACRDGSLPDPKPPADGKFEFVVPDVACVKGIVQPKNIGKKEEIVDALKNAIEKF